MSVRAIKPFMIRLFTLIFFFSFLQSSLANKFPTRPVKLVVCFGAGGSTDVIVRVMNDQLGKRLGVPAVVLNKPGSGGLVGAQFVARAKPDGYTILVMSLSHLLRQAIDTRIPIDVFRDFELVCRYVSQPLLLGVQGPSKFKTIDDLISFARKNPRKISYASPGIGSTGHFSSELFINATKTKQKHVPFKGDAAATLAVMGGHVDWSVTGLSKYLPKIASGHVRVLATFSKTRIPEMKDVPTFVEKGYPKVVMYSWFGFAVPRGTPKEIINKLNSSIRGAIKDPLTQEKLKNLYFHDFYTGPAKFSKFIKTDFERFKKVAQELGINVER